MLITAIILVTLALILYSLSVGRHFLGRKVSLPVLWTGWAGLAADAGGTLFMFLISPGVRLDMHSLLGFLALGLMAVKAVWNTYSYKKAAGESPVSARWFGLGAWGLWALVFFMGMGPR